MSPTVPQWKERQVPLKPEAAAGKGETATALLRRLLECDDEQLGRLQGALGGGVVVVVGSEEVLPWVKGTTYLGRDERAPNLYLPTALEPDIAPDLLDQALKLRYERSPLAVLPAWSAVLPLDTLRPLTRDRIMICLEAKA
jgi:hypothetical protein